MNKQEFIDSIKIAVLEGSISSVQRILESPPGRSPSHKIIELSAWYKKLENEDKEAMLKVIRESIETSVFVFLCVLDGVTAIEGIGEKGELKLYYEKNNKSVLLNNHEEEYLHNLL